MRRGCSVVLFVLGGWFLASIGVIGIFPNDEQISPWFFVAVFAVIAAPFLLIGAWVSPGKRLVELGLTLMITTGVALFMVLGLFALSIDKAAQRMMPEPLPPLDFTSPALIVSLLVMGGGGYLLWRTGQRRG